MLHPDICFVSVNRSDVLTVGPFESLIRPLIHDNEVDVTSASSDRIIVPCLARQVPAIRQRLGHSVRLLRSKPLVAEAQASLRTVSFKHGSAFPHDLKFALACNITSALRTVTPWTVLVGPEISGVLGKLLPASMWVCNEIAAVTGSQPDFDQAKHVSVLVRENLEAKARSRGECLIIAAALAERGLDGEECHAARVFQLVTVAQKKAWLRM